MGVLFHVGLFALITTLNVIVRGMIISSVWGWYLVPLGVKNVNWAAAMGISTLISLFTSGMSGSQEKEYAPVKTFIVATLVSLLVLFVAWLLKGFAVYGS